MHKYSIDNVCECVSGCGCANAAFFELLKIYYPFSHSRSLFRSLPFFHDEYWICAQWKVNCICYPSNAWNVYIAGVQIVQTAKNQTKQSKTKNVYTHTAHTPSKLKQTHRVWILCVCARACVYAIVVIKVCRPMLHIVQIFDLLNKPKYMHFNYINIHFVYCFERFQFWHKRGGKRIMAVSPSHWNTFHSNVRKWIQTNAEHVQQRHSVNSIRMEQGFPEGFSFVASSNQRESNVSE